MGGYLTQCGMARLFNQFMDCSMRRPEERSETFHNTVVLQSIKHSQVGSKVDGDPGRLLLRLSSGYPFKHGLSLSVCSTGFVTKLNVRTAMGYSDLLRNAL